jgi:cell fate (sporulation/competence/biofilm development) regulator YlbF (YheA/YmcA/DUF963 family)
MAKHVTAFSATKVGTASNINEGARKVEDDEDAKELIEALIQDSEDLETLLRENQHQEAIETVEDIQTATGLLLDYLKDKE